MMLFSIARSAPAALAAAAYMVGQVPGASAGVIARENTITTHVTDTICCTRHTITVTLYRNTTDGVVTSTTYNVSSVPAVPAKTTSVSATSASTSGVAAASATASSLSTTSAAVAYYTSSIVPYIMPTVCSSVDVSRLVPSTINGVTLDSTVGLPTVTSVAAATGLPVYGGSSLVTTPPFTLALPTTGVPGASPSASASITSYTGGSGKIAESMGVVAVIAGGLAAAFIV